MSWNVPLRGNWPRRLKRIAAVLLLAAFFLPLSSCTREASQGQPAQVQYHYAWSGFDRAEPQNYLLLLVFVWPLAALAMARRHGIIARVGWWLEAPLLGMSAYALCAWTWVDRPEIGSLVYALGLVSHTAAWLAEALAGVRTRLWPEPTGP